tara:strand:- start:4226 stop:5452 length:1227 start_codon:yes stop_codon:yes gene_type:complete
MLVKKNKYLILYSLFLFVIAAIYGLLLRWNFVFPSKIISYKNVLQGHSHVAFLGWGYLATIGIILKLFITKDKKLHKTYKWALAIICITIFLMLISFISSGYKVFSIGLLSIFGIVSYVLSFRILKDLTLKKTSEKLVRTGIYYYLLSSLATWFLAFVIVTQGKTELYYNSVYFYLHFLYNGFFVFVLFGILFKILENQEITISERLKKHFFVFLNLACVPAYTLSILWSTNNLVFNNIGFLAAILQLISLVFLIKILKQAYVQLQWNYISKLLLKFAMVAYSLKIIAQIASSFPYFVKKSLALKPFFIIGYLHLFTLAFMSVFVLLILNQLKFISFKKFGSKIGIGLFLLGILLTELLLFLQGFLILFHFNAINYYNQLLLVASLLIVIGLIFVVISQIIKYKNSII